MGCGTCLARCCGPLASSDRRCNATEMLLTQLAIHENYRLQADIMELEEGAPQWVAHVTAFPRGAEHPRAGAERLERERERCVLSDRLAATLDAGWPPGARAR